jgi:hypothetical protein
MLNDNELDPGFVQQVAEFCSSIFNYSKTKTLSGGIKVNGPCESPSQSFHALESEIICTQFQFWQMYWLLLVFC